MKHRRVMTELEVVQYLSVEAAAVSVNVTHVSRMITISLFTYSLTLSVG